MAVKTNNPPRRPQTGTDYRDDERGKYQWPHLFWQRPGEPVEEFWAVSTVLELLESFGKVREYWQSGHTVELAELGGFVGLVEIADTILDILTKKRPAEPGEMARLLHLAQQQKTYDKWDHDLKQMIAARPVDLITNREWIEGAGWRELNRAAARGTVVHKVIEERSYEIDAGKPGIDYTDERTVYNYTLELIEDERRKRGSFFVDVEPCYLYVQQALRWLDMHVKKVHMAEVAVFNRTLGYAGTVDLDVELKNTPGIWRIDAKTSKSHYDSHRIQLSAYYNAEFAAPPNCTELIPLDKPDHVANLYIGTNGAVLREWWTDKHGVVQPDERDKDFAAFFSLLLTVMPRVKKQPGDDGRNHAINPVTVKACSNMPPKASKEEDNEASAT